MLPQLSSLFLAVLASFPAQEASEPKARTTVLHLADGTVLRAKARERGADWEVQSRGEWQLVPGELVTRARPEHELLVQAERLERALPKDDLVRRVAYADWLVGEGLQVEGLAQIERVLARDADQADALALLARARLPLAVPDVPADAAALEPFLVSLTRLTPAGREVAIQRLKGAPEVPGLRAALAAELVARTPLRRASAALVLRRMFPGSELQGLLGRAILDSSEDVRTSAALALRAAELPELVSPALRAVSSKNSAVRSNAIAALGAMNYREAVEPLYEHLLALQSGSGSKTPHTHIFVGKQTAYVQDFDVEVAQGQSIADPIINVMTEGAVLDVGVIGVTEYSVQSERAGVRRALSSLTGADPGDTTAAWQRWWGEHGAEWQTRVTAPVAPTTPDGRGN